MESVFQVFEKSLDEAINNALLDIQSMSPKSRFILRKKGKDLHQGDITVPSGCFKLDSKQHEKLMLLMKEYCASADTLTNRVSCDKYSLLTFFIDRPKMCGCIVEEITRRGCKYGYSDNQADKVISLHPVTLKKTTSLMAMRLSVVKFHARKLLEANGYIVLPAMETDISESDQNLQASSEDNTGKEIDCQNPGFLDGSRSDCQNTSLCRQLILSRINSATRDMTTDSKNCTAVCNSELSEPVDVGTCETLKDFLIHEDEGNIFINTQRVVSSKNLFQGKGRLDANLKIVQVLQDRQPTEVLEESMRVLGCIPGFPQIKKHHCLHVLPHNASFTDQKIVVTLHSLVECGLSQSQMIIGPINVQETCSDSSPSAQEFYKSRFCQFKDASEMRNAISSQECSDDDVKILTDASIKIDVLGNACGNPLTLENTASGRGAESRLGAFILYNTARLSTLLHKFDQAVTEGIYPPLPSVDLIDWTLLREEEDWELVYVYLAAFPEVVTQSVESLCPSDGKLSARIHTHKVTNFLVSFCKCLSSHYSRYHILTGRESHLLPLMYARLYLMKAAHQVLLNSLQLMGVKSLSYV